MFIESFRECSGGLDQIKRTWRIIIKIPDDKRRGEVCLATEIDINKPGNDLLIFSG